MRVLLSLIILAATVAVTDTDAADYAEVDAYIDAGEYGKAADALAEMVAAEPGDARLHNDYGTMLFQVGDYDGARAEFEKAVELDAAYASPLNNLGYYYTAVEGDAEKAIPYFVSAAQLEHDDTAISNLFTCYLSVGNVDGAIDTFEELTDRWPESARVRNDLGTLYLYKNDLGNARKYLGESISLDPEYYHPVVNLARVEIADGDYEAAEKLLEPLVESGESRGSTLWDAWVYLYVAQADGEGALAAAETAVEKEPGAESYNNLASVYHMLDDYGRAIDAATRSLSYDETSYAHYVKGYSALLGEFKLDMALNELARAVEMDPYYTDAWYALAEVLFKLGSFEESKNAYLKTFELDPASSDAYASAGIAYFMAGDREKAAEVLYDALARFPDDPKANHGVAVLLLDEGKYEDAIPYAERTVELADDYGDAYNTLSYIYAELGRFEDAYAALKKAAEQLERESFVHLNLGIAAYRTGRLDEAVDAFTLAIGLSEPAAEVNAGYATTAGQAYAGRAIVRAKLGDFAGAATDADAAEGYVGEHSVILFVRARVADAEGDAAGRDELLERVVEINEEVLAEGETLGS
ncbi:MAG: tetratricopeptide repeat protein, partial [Candidatus Coatesbacteria bacterium]